MTESPIKVAVVGAGPSGFYAAEALLRLGDHVQVDLYEKLPVPYGLVRYGVAPDHPKLKSASKTFDRIARMPGFRFFGNVVLGQDLKLATLRDYYRAVVVACGTPESQLPGIAGESLPGSHGAAEFVAWYNGHPEFQDRQFDLQHQHAVVIGNGNVALDVARVLLRPTDELRATDISTPALEQLRDSQVTDVHIVGRRGLLDAKFASKELREMGQLTDCATIVDPQDLPDPASLSEQITESREKQSILKAFTQFAQSDHNQPRRCHFHFARSPHAVIGDGAVQSIQLERNELQGAPGQTRVQATGRFDSIDCGLVLYSIGYRGVPIQGLPCEPKRGLVPNEAGRVLNDGSVVPGLYVSGWIKRGPTGLIGSNRPDSNETIDLLVQDWPTLPAAPHELEDLPARLEADGLTIFTDAHWQRIKAEEIRRGEAAGRAAVKFTAINEMLGYLAD